MSCNITRFVSVPSLPSSRDSSPDHVLKSEVHQKREMTTRHTDVTAMLFPSTSYAVGKLKVRFGLDQKWLFASHVAFQRAQGHILHFRRVHVP